MSGLSFLAHLRCSYSYACRLPGPDCTPQLILVLPLTTSLRRLSMLKTSKKIWKSFTSCLKIILILMLRPIVKSLLRRRGYTIKGISWEGGLLLRVRSTKTRGMPNGCTITLPARLGYMEVEGTSPTLLALTT